MEVSVLIVHIAILLNLFPDLNRNWSDTIIICINAITAAFSINIALSILAGLYKFVTYCIEKSRKTKVFLTPTTLSTKSNNMDYLNTTLSLKKNTVEFKHSNI